MPATLAKEEWVASSRKKLAVPEAESILAPKRAVYEYDRVSPKCIRLREAAGMVGMVADYENKLTADYVKTISKLIELLELPSGWNSYGARQIRKENVNVAVGLLGRIMRPGTPPPIVVPTVRGGVQLEWHTRGLNVEIDISSPEEVSFFAEDIRAAEDPIEEELDEYSLSRWIDRLSA